MLWKAVRLGDVLGLLFDERRLARFVGLGSDRDFQAFDKRAHVSGRDEHRHLFGPKLIQAQAELAHVVDDIGRRPCPRAVKAAVEKGFA